MTIIQKYNWYVTKVSKKGDTIVRDKLNTQATRFLSANGVGSNLEEDSSVIDLHGKGKTEREGANRGMCFKGILREPADAGKRPRGSKEVREGGGIHHKIVDSVLSV